MEEDIVTIRVHQDHLLIYKAAPDLLKACEEAAVALEDADVDCIGDSCPFCQVAEQLRAAAAKARGEG